jgi:hypothetical protein
METSTSAAAAPPSRIATGHARVDRMLQGMLGAGHLDQAALEGGSIDLSFRQDDRYFVNEEFIARLTIGAAFGLLFRCGLGEARFVFHRDGQKLRLLVAKDAFAAFFGLRAEQMQRIASDPARFEESPIRKVNGSRQWEFYLQFTKDA